MSEKNERPAASDDSVGERTRVARSEIEAEILRLQVAWLTAAARQWQWTDESLPGIDGRCLISVNGSCREGFYKDGKFTDKYGEQKPEAWMSMPMAPLYRNGRYVGH